MTQPLVSVVIPCFNQGRFLDEAVRSCLSQTWTNIEVIVVDDGSTDETVDVMRAAARHDDRVRVMSTPNRGLGAARNRGITESRGALLNVLDADDRLYPDKIAHQSAILLDNPDVGVVLSDVDFIDEAGAMLPSDGLHLDRLDGPDTWFDTLLAGGLFPPHAPLVRRSLVDTVGGFSEDRAVAGHADYLLWLSIAALGTRVYVLPEVLASYRRLTGSMSQNGRHMNTSRRLALASLASSVPDRVAQGIARLGDDTEVLRMANGVLTSTCQSQRARLAELERTQRDLQFAAALGTRPAAPVFIWGTGAKGRAVAAHLTGLPRRPTAFVDSAPERWGARVDGLPVLSPDEALAVPAHLVVVASMYADDIGRALRARGVTDFVVAP